MVKKALLLLVPVLLLGVQAANSGDLKSALEGKWQDTVKAQGPSGRGPAFDKQVNLTLSEIKEEDGKWVVVKAYYGTDKPNIQIKLDGDSVKIEAAPAGRNGRLTVELVEGVLKGHYHDGVNQIPIYLKKLP